MKQPDTPGPDSEERAKEKIEQEILTLKRVVENAEVEEVDEPTGRKCVEVAWEDESGFHVEEGEAYGVYRERDENGSLERLHIDWTDDRDRTSVQADDVMTLEEGEWYQEPDIPSNKEKS